MKKIILMFVLCFISRSVFADKPVVSHHKKHKTVTVIPPAPVVVVPPSLAEKSLPPLSNPPAVILPPLPLPPVTAPPMPKLCSGPPNHHICPPENKYFLPNLHLGIGVGARSPWASGLIGMRLEFPIAYLAIEPFVSLPAYGVGIDTLVYAYRGSIVQFYPLSVGFMINWNHPDSHLGHLRPYLSDQDIDRGIDLRVGAGLQIRLACHVKLSLDWRTNIPEPEKLVRENGVCHNCGANGAVALDANAAVKNAFSQSQLLVGILIQ